MALQKLGLDGLDKLQIDTETGALFFDGVEVVTRTVHELPLSYEIIGVVLAVLTTAATLVMAYCALQAYRRSIRET